MKSKIFLSLLYPLACQTFVYGQSQVGQTSSGSIQIEQATNQQVENPQATTGASETVQPGQVVPYKKQLSSIGEEPVFLSAS